MAKSKQVEKKSKKEERKSNMYKGHFLSLMINGIITKETVKTELDKKLFKEFNKLRSKKKKYEKLAEIDKLVLEFES